MRRHEVARRLRVVGAPPREQLVAEQAQCVDVALRRDRLGEQLLRAHVCGRSHSHAGRRDAHVALVTLGLLEGGDTEIRHGRTLTLVVPEDVRRLDVAVHDATTVCGRERRGHVAQHTLGHIDRKGTGCGEPIGHAAAGHVLHDEVGRAVGQLAHTVDGHHVGVRHSGDGLRFALRISTIC